MRLASKGQVDRKSFNLAKAKGIDLAGGYVRGTDKRAIIGNVQFLALGMKHRYMLRSRIVWWLRTGEVLRGFKWNLHHKNHDRLDDRFENLEKVEHSAHSKEHHPLGEHATERVCRYCNKQFTINIWRLREKGRGTFCSLPCCFAYRRTRFSKTCLWCGTVFAVGRAALKRRKVCSSKCAGHRSGLMRRKYARTR